MYKLKEPAMDHNRYGLDGQPLYPRPGHFDHVTGHPLPTFTIKSDAGHRPLAGPLAAMMVVVGVFLAYMSGLLG
jgi:hypothetical protein